MVDGPTGRRWMSVDVERALPVVEEDARALRTVRWHPFEGAVTARNDVPSPAGVRVPDNDDRASTVEHTQAA
jgi:hypothetical protein